MRRDKYIAFKLRREGRSYRDIQNELGISRSTLCDWFRDEDWSKHVKKSNIQKHIEVSTERLKKMNTARDLVLKKMYEDILEEAKIEYPLYVNDPLFVAGLMLYAGEGDHLSKGEIRLANVDFNIHKIFINFAMKYLKIDKKKLKFSVLLYPDLNVKECLERWTSELSLINKNIYKPQVIKGKLRARKLHFGVGTSIILNSFLKKKLLYWIDQSKKDLSINFDAGII